jgi:hypothetical protein
MTTMFSNKMLYIPDYVVYEDIPTIIKYFEDFNIAKIKNVQVLKHLEPEYYVEDKYNYCYALIEVEFYYNNQGAQNFYNAIENNKCAMVYDDPLYWEVQFSPFKEHAMPLASNSNSSTSTNSNNICDCLTHNVNEVCVASEEEDYYSSEEDDQEEDDSKDPDYEDEEEYEDEDEYEESDDDYNYETYKKNYASFKSKQKAKKQKLLNELSEMKKTIELIKNKQEKMRLLLIQNKKSKSKTKEYKTNWARRLRTII